MAKATSVAYALQGTFVHCPSLGQVEILRDHLLLVDDQGFISQICPASLEASQEFIRQYGSSVKILPPGHLLLPTFCDLHLHAPQFMYQGTGLDLPLMQWLDNYAFKAEESLDANPDLARKVYKRLAQRLTEVGTGAVLLFGTIKTETNLILAEEMQTAGLRAFVGKLSMDISSRPSYKELDANESLSFARDFIQRCRDSVAHLEEHRRLVEPVITPRFVPTCSDALLKGLADISSGPLRIQSHLAEAYEEVKWVEDERGMDDIRVFQKYNLLREGTVQAHCTFLDSASLDHLARSNTAVAHCPLSNAYFSEKPFPLREALDKKVRVGLGTDVAGGYSIDIMNSMRHAVAVSRMREGTHALNAKLNPTGNSNSTSLAIEWKESLYLSTRGGSQALGLKSGEFKVGVPFDAQEIAVYDFETSSGVGVLDFFDSQSQDTGITLDMIEKWWCMGDFRNRTAMWVQGRQISRAG
ncbi:hypothetical protein F5I97DRAFT_1884009 [Phlebopus sp. FC_14]|nr:hypothetical protein F5I97DRAFT_1884009 [Phlebopus sp. FC_14]